MLSSHLAVNLATAGYRTAADRCRSSSACGLQGIPPAKRAGLYAKFLEGMLTYRLRSSQGSGQLKTYRSLLAGNCGRTAGPTFDLSIALGKLLPILRQQYDYIIVDSGKPCCPWSIPSSSPSMWMASYLSVIKNVSRLPKRFTQRVEQLVTLDVRVLGVVVHGVTNESYYHDYALHLPKHQLKRSVELCKALESAWLLLWRCFSRTVWWKALDKPMAPSRGIGNRHHQGCRRSYDDWGLACQNGGVGRSGAHRGGIEGYILRNYENSGQRQKDYRAADVRATRAS